jgi:peptidoglycan/LPS O-acetylase OafA/YrhL
VRRLGHVPALDGIRGVAILAVLAFHSDFFHYGYYGVDLFFALSGFLITSLLVGEWARAGTVSFRSFYRRRALRLLPAALAALGLYLLVSTWQHAAGLVDPAAWREASMTVAFAATYTLNMALAAGFNSGLALTHFWSLSLEEQFYLLWPPLLVFALRHGVRPSLLAWALVVLAAGSATERIWLWSSDVPAERFTYGSDTRAAAILAGCALGVAWSHRIVDVRLPGWLVWPLERRWLIWVGSVSYGLYVWHYLLFNAIGWPGGLPLSFLAAWISMRYLEKPFLRRKARERSGKDVDGKPRRTSVRDQALELA